MEKYIEYGTKLGEKLKGGNFNNKALIHNLNKHISNRNIEGVGTLIELYIAAKINIPGEISDMLMNCLASKYEEEQAHLYSFFVGLHNATVK